MKKSQRSFFVFASLVGVLTLTSALLLALAPAPLSPDASASLSAVGSPGSLDIIFDTKVTASPNRWKYIFIHHSQTPGGNAVSLAQANKGFGTHFLIGNGDGTVDGEIQIGQRWNQQLAPMPPSGATQIDPSCITITLVGDFDNTVPTPMQIRRLNDLTRTLQAHVEIPAQNVLFLDRPNIAAGIGKYFPASAFREHLLNASLSQAYSRND